MLLTIFPWLTPIGLAFDLVGVSIVTWGAFVNPEQALELGLHTYTRLDEALQGTSPRVRHVLTQSRRAKWGLLFMVLGFGLQLIAALPIWRLR